MKFCRRTRKVWPDAIWLECVSSRSPLAWPSLTNEYILTDWPTRSIVTSLRAHSPLSNSSLPVSSRTALPLPVGFLLPSPDEQDQQDEQDEQDKQDEQEEQEEQDNLEELEKQERHTRAP